MAGIANSLLAALPRKCYQQLALGIDASPVRALVQGGGPALRMNPARFRRELSRSPPLQRELHRYVYALMAQIS